MTARRFAAPEVAQRHWDSVQFRVIFALSFLVFLPIAIGARLVPAHWRRDSPHRSILADACAGAGTTAQIALWG